MPNPSVPTLRERLTSHSEHYHTGCNCGACNIRREAAAALDEAERVKKEACGLLSMSLTWVRINIERDAIRAFLSAHDPKPKEKENG